MLFTTTGWIWFWILIGISIILTLAGIALTRNSKDSFTSEDSFMGGLLFYFVALLTTIIVVFMLAYGVKNSNARNDLKAVGFDVVSVATDSNRATVVKDGKRMIVELYKSPVTGRYTPYLLCEVGREVQQPIDQCITNPSDN